MSCIEKYEEYIRLNKEYLEKVDTPDDIDKLPDKETIQYLIRDAFCQGFNEGRNYSVRK